MASTAADLAQLKTREEEEGSLKAVRFQQQDFQQLRAESLNSGKLFCDPVFPADCESLGFNTLGRYSSRTRGIEWKRPTELSSDPQFIVDGAKRMDICQGALGDCWLLAALASLTLDPQILDRVVPPGQSFSSQYAGIFHFQFWQFGEWVDVVIDDRLPVKDGELLFVHSAEGREFWSALLEKAYAKVSGSYEALSGGSSLEGFEDFTGGISESYDLKEAPPSLFHIMRRGLRLGSLMGCSIDSTEEILSGEQRRSSVESRGDPQWRAEETLSGEQRRPSVESREDPQWRAEETLSGEQRRSSVESRGDPQWRAEETLSGEQRRPSISSSSETEAVTGQKLVKGHAYSITAVRQVHHCGSLVELLRIRNPWGQVEWTGAWSDGSKQWDGVEEKDLVHSADDGEFWMCYADFLRQFSRLDICNLSPDALSGCLEGGVHRRGCRNYPATFCSNPQFLVRLLEEDEGLQEGEEGCTLILGLLQRDARRERRFLMRSFINLREVSERFVLPPGEYAVIPSTFEPHRRGSFLLRVFTEKQAHTGPLEEQLTADVQEIDDEEAMWTLTSDVSFCRSLETTLRSPSSSFNTSWTEWFLRTDGFSLQTCRDIISLLDTDGSGKLDLKEFHCLWTRVQKYLEVFQRFDSDASGTMSSHEMRAAQIVSRFSDQSFSVDFDSFLGCLIRLQLLLKMFKTLDVKKEGKIHLDLQQVNSP
ncbi:Calpain-3 [Dissostichus eleginoides]|uniref:Calpain-3 n=1 Tax=Dissostichus eleginoides TaxID=100907 RepID=A0AAD9B5F7_DISEL|nr:Calpain-3 [Dissostichus eleginoides]